MKIDKTTTARGFGLYEFTDSYGEKCSLQESSNVCPHIWLGPDDADPKIFLQGQGWKKLSFPEDAMFNTRMHLTPEQVRVLLPLLDHFANTGEFPNVLEEETVIPLEERLNATFAEKMTDFKQGDRLRHYKHGHIYVILTVGKATEYELEETVAYHREDGTGPVWMRPASMFWEFVTLEDGTEVPRFELIEIVY